MFSTEEAQQNCMPLNLHTSYDILTEDLSVAYLFPRDWMRINQWMADIVMDIADH